MLRKKIIIFSLKNRFAECNSQKYSANNNPLPSVFSKTLGKPLFLPSVKFDTRQTICRVRDKKHSANSCLPTHRCRVLYVECYTRQSICRVFFGLCRVPLALGKTTVSRSEYPLCPKIEDAMRCVQVKLSQLWLSL